MGASIAREIQAAAALKLRERMRMKVEAQGAVDETLMSGAAQL